MREGRLKMGVSADPSADLSFDPLARSTHVTAQARADAAEAALRERDIARHAAADTAAVRVRELEAALGSLQGSTDGPEADLRSQTAKVLTAGHVTLNPALLLSELLSKPARTHAGKNQLFLCFSWTWCQLIGCPTEVYA